MSWPAVSVIITTCNRCDLVQRALQSVLRQEYPRFDVHIVDDASDDDTEQSLAPLIARNAHVFYWRHSKRKGLPAARNTGISHSTGEYIAFLDDDDEWKPECIETRVALFKTLTPAERERCGVVYCGCETRIVPGTRCVYNMPRVLGDIKACICTDDLFTIPSSCLFPRAVLDQVGGYDEELVSSVDHDVWMKLAVHGCHAYAVDEPFVITYETEKRKAMVTDVTFRIQGVEQYLHKWASTFEDWFGKPGADAYIRSYRTRVLGSLAGRKLCERDWRAAFHLIHHVVSENGYAPGAIMSLSSLLGRSVLRACIPSRALGRIKGDAMGKPAKARSRQ